jgi:hypothetical protein
MIKKKGQFSFVWIFAIIAGGAILFLAIYGALQVADTRRFQQDTEIAKSISILTDPLQAGFAESSFGKISFKQETRINNICFDGEFGKNDLSVSVRSNVGKPWNDPGGATSIKNKYIFSDEKNTGKEYYIFSKPFEFPYEVSDLLFITPKNYCFLTPPEKVIEDLGGLNIPNIQLADSPENCTLTEPVKVCFGIGTDCDIRVSGTCQNCDSQYDEGNVAKDGGEKNFVGNLMYAAIFSERNIYECNVKRLYYRSEKIAKVLIEKADLMDARGCDSNLETDLAQWVNSLRDQTSEGIINLNVEAEELNKKNSRELCGLW